MIFSYPIYLLYIIYATIYRLTNIRVMRQASQHLYAGLYHPYDIFVGLLNNLDRILPACLLAYALPHNAKGATTEQ